MDRRAQQRLSVLIHVLADELTVEAAAQVLELSIRQTRRLVERYRSGGAGGLVHGNRGRVPANRLDDATRARVVELAQTTYAGFNPVHLAETLAEETDELGLSARTIRRILAAGGIEATRTRRPPRHRECRIHDMVKSAAKEPPLVRGVTTKWSEKPVTSEARASDSSWRAP